MIAKFSLAMVIGGLAPFLPDCFTVWASGSSGSVPRSVTVNPGPVPNLPILATKRACEGCGYTQPSGTGCANCTISIVWGGGNTPGVCKQVTPCGATQQNCEFGAFTIRVTAVSPGCEITWWTSTGWATPFDLEDGVAKKDYGSAANPFSTPCGSTLERVKCNGTPTGPECVQCTS